MSEAPMREATLGRLEFLSSELAKVPKDDVAFLMSSCLAATEIGVFIRLVLFSLNTSQRNPIKDGVMREYANVQALVLQRNFSAKIFEYILMLDVYCKKARRKSSSAGDFLTYAEETVHWYRSHPCYTLAKTLRDKVTSHYSVHHLAAELDGATTERHYTMYLHEKDIDSLFPLAEHLLLGNLVDKDIEMREIGEINSFAQQAANRAQRGHSLFVIYFLERYFPEKAAIQIKAVAEPHLVGSMAGSTLPVVMHFR